MVNLSVEEPDALMCARPDLWEPRVATPGATRPEAAKLIGQTVFGRAIFATPTRASNLAKTRRSFRPLLLTVPGKLTKITTHRCAQRPRGLVRSLSGL